MTKDSKTKKSEKYHVLKGSKYRITYKQIKRKQLVYKPRIILYFFTCPMLSIQKYVFVVARHEQNR